MVPSEVRSPLKGGQNALLPGTAAPIRAHNYIMEAAMAVGIKQMSITIKQSGQDA